MLVVNMGNTSVRVNVSVAADFGISATARMDVRDIWEQKAVGTQSAIVAKMQVSVAETHGCTWLIQKLYPSAL